MSGSGTDPGRAKSEDRAMDAQEVSASEVPVSRGLPALRWEELDVAGRQVWEGLIASRGQDIVDSDGGLVGPFNAWVTAPNIGAHLERLGAALRYEMTVERRLIELAVLTVGARWRAEFEWWSHARLAYEHGVGRPIIDAIERGEDPPLDQPEERLVYAIASTLMNSGSLTPEIREAGRSTFGDRGMVELVSLCGFYTLVSLTLNAFEVPIPSGQPYVWRR